MRANFGLSYTQDESYYILNAVEHAHVYLGLKKGITQERCCAISRLRRLAKQSSMPRYPIREATTIKSGALAVRLGLVSFQYQSC
jgi:hypothetical protein